MSERELLEILITHEHINALERERLPGRRARVSVLVEIICDYLARKGKFPDKHELKDDFDGALILVTGPSEYRIYRKAEASYLHYQVIKEEISRDPREAALTYLKFAYRDQIDGIPLDWG